MKKSCANDAIHAERTRIWKIHHNKLSYSYRLPSNWIIIVLLKIMLIAISKLCANIDAHFWYVHAFDFNHGSILISFFPCRFDEDIVRKENILTLWIRSSNDIFEECILGCDQAPPSSRHCFLFRYSRNRLFNTHNTIWLLHHVPPNKMIMMMTMMMFDVLKRWWVLTGLEKWGVNTFLTVAGVSIWPEIISNEIKITQYSWFFSFLCWTNSPIRYWFGF